MKIVSHAVQHACGGTTFVPLKLRLLAEYQQPQSPAASEIDPLGKHVKEAIATINLLEGLGLQRLKIPLPKCIVLGKMQALSRANND